MCVEWKINHLVLDLRKSYDVQSKKIIIRHCALERLVIIQRENEKEDFHLFFDFL